MPGAGRAALPPPPLGPSPVGWPIAVGRGAGFYGSQGVSLFEPCELNWFNDLTSHCAVVTT